MGPALSISAQSSVNLPITVQLTSRRKETLFKISHEGFVQGPRQTTTVKLHCKRYKYRNYVVLLRIRRGWL